VPISAALRQGPHFKVVTAVASRWQRAADLLGSGFKPHTSNQQHQKQTSL